MVDVDQLCKYQIFSNTLENDPLIFTFSFQDLHILLNRDTVNSTVCLGSSHIGAMNLKCSIYGKVIMSILVWKIFHKCWVCMTAMPCGCNQLKVVYLHYRFLIFWYFVGNKFSKKFWVTYFYFHYMCIGVNDFIQVLSVYGGHLM